MILLSIVSCLFSLFVMLTYFMFPEMRKKLFMKLIFYMSLADFGMNVVSAFGFPPDGSALCWIQGMCQIYFAISSWLWTTVLSYSIYSLMKYEKIYHSERATHILCWGLPLLLAVIPIANFDYGAPSPDYQWCYLTSRGAHPDWAFDFWSYASFFGWFFLCVLLMITWTILVLVRLVYLKSVLSTLVHKTYSKVWLYPVVMVVCWALNYAIIVNFSTNSSAWLVGMSMILGISNGMISAVVFICKSDEARQRWYFYFYPSMLVDDAFENCRNTVILEDFAVDETDFVSTEHSTTSSIHESIFNKSFSSREGSQDSIM